MQARGVYFHRDGLLQTAPAPRFDGRVVVPGAIPVRGQDTEAVMAALLGCDSTSAWLS
ncbi:hypothetical protein D3C85_1487040 [compost metagenome]